MFVMIFQLGWKTEAIKFTIIGAILPFSLLLKLNDRSFLILAEFFWWYIGFYCKYINTKNKNLKTHIFVYQLPSRF